MAILWHGTSHCEMPSTCPITQVYYMHYKGVYAKEYKDVLLQGGKDALAGLFRHAQDIFSSRFIRDWVFQQDMPRIHVAVVKLLKEICPHVLPWPCNSPDFSLVDNVWSLVQCHSTMMRCGMTCKASEWPLLGSGRVLHHTHSTYTTSTRACQGGCNSALPLMEILWTEM